MTGTPRNDPAPTAIHRLVEALRRGAEPRMVARTPSGWLVMGDPQVVPGYCLLLPDPVVPSLNALVGEARVRFLDDMVAIGDALLALTGAARINYEILGNLEPALHAHIVPRRVDEPEALRTKPIWMYDWKSARPFDPGVDGALQADLGRALRAAGRSSG